MRYLQYKDIQVCFKLMLLTILIMLFIAGPKSTALLGYWEWWVHLVWIIKIPAPRERLLMLFDVTLQCNPEPSFPWGKCQSIDFSVTWVCVFTVLTFHLKSAMPVSQRWTNLPLRFDEIPFSSTVGILCHPGGLSKTAGCIFIIFHLQSGSFRGVVLCSAVLYCPMGWEGGRDEMSPHIYILIVFLLG